MTTSKLTLKATRREWIGLAVLALPCILATMDLTVLNLAVPHLTEELKPTTSQLLWILDIYGFMIAGSLITMGTLGDRIGRRKVLMMGAVAFGIASLCAAFSRSANVLIVTRGFLGVAGATLAPSTLSLIRNMFHDDRERTVAISIWVTCFSVGATIGPVLGGIVLEHFRWGAVFLLNVPVMILLLVLAPILLPEFRDPTAGRLDILSAAMSLVAVLLIIFGLKKVAEYGFNALPLTCIAAGFVIGYLFIRRQTLLSDPLIDIRLFYVTSFNAALSLNMLGCFIAFGAFYFTAQYLQLVLGLTPLQAGLWSAPSSISFTIGSMLTPQIIRKVSAGTLIAVELVVAALGFFILGQTHGPSALFILVAGTFIYSIGISPIFTLSTDLVISSSPPERAGAAASVSETCTEFGGAVGMAVLGSLGMVVYRSKLLATLPINMPPDVVEAARGTLGGAVSAAASLPADLSAMLLSSAQMSFAHALQMTAYTCSAISLVMAVIAWSLLRNKKPLTCYDK